MIVARSSKLAMRDPTSVPSAPSVPLGGSGRLVDFRRGQLLIAVSLDVPMACLTQQQMR